MSGVLAIFQAVLPLLREAPAARIVNVSSAFGLRFSCWLEILLAGQVATIFSISGLVYLYFYSPLPSFQSMLLPKR